MLKRPIRIMCFGDSNTWGYTPVTGERYPENIRYPGVLAKKLGDNYRVIEEGLNARTIAFGADYVRPNRCGMEHLEPTLSSHFPLDYLVIMLGTNDTQPRFSAWPDEIALGLERMILEAKKLFYIKQSKTEIIIMAPVPYKQVKGNFFLADELIDKTKALTAKFKKVARMQKCHFINLDNLTKPLGDDRIGADGIHLTAASHKIAGEALAELILELEAK